jgi:hypothetical protein
MAGICGWILVFSGVLICHSNGRPYHPPILMAFSDSDSDEPAVPVKRPCNPGKISCTCLGLYQTLLEQLSGTVSTDPEQGGNADCEPGPGKQGSSSARWQNLHQLVFVVPAEVDNPGSQHQCMVPNSKALLITTCGGELLSLNQLADTGI